MNASKQNEKATFGSLFSFLRRRIQDFYMMLTDSSLMNGFSARAL